MPDLELLAGTSPVGTVITVARIAAQLGSTAANNARYMELRSTPAYRAAEGARRGEPTRAQLVAGGMVRGTAGSIPSESLPPQLGVPGLGTAPGTHPIALGQGSFPILALPPGVIGPLMGQTATSTRAGQSSTIGQPPRRYGDFDNILEGWNAARRRAVMRIVQRAVAAGVNIILIEEAFRSIWQGLTPDELTPEQQRDAEQRFRREVEKLTEIQVGASPQTYPLEPGQLGEVVVNVPKLPGGIGPGGPSYDIRPLPGTGPRSTRRREPLTVRIRRGITQNLEKIVLSTLGLGAVASLRRGSTPPATVNIAPGAFAPIPEAQSRPLTLVGTSGVPLQRTGQQTCECKAQKKRKRRKCLERAQVAWRSGRYKGKLAGTKCVRFRSE